MSELKKYMSEIAGDVTMEKRGKVREFGNSVIRDLQGKIKEIQNLQKKLDKADMKGVAKVEAAMDQVMVG